MCNAATSNTRPPLAISALFLAALGYGSFGLFVRESYEMFGVNAQTAVRGMIALIVVLFIGLATRTLVRVRKPQLQRVVALGICAGLTSVLATYSAVHTELSTLIFTLYAGSIVTSLVVGYFAFSERITQRSALAIACALLGLASYAEPILSLNSGVLAGLGAGICFGAGNGLRKLVGETPRATVMSYEFAVTTIVCFLLVAVTREPAVKDVALVPFLYTVALALLMVGIAVSLIYAFQRVDVHLGSVILAMEVVFAVLLGFIVYDELPTKIETLGGLSILAGAVIASGVSLPRRPSH